MMKHRIGKIKRIMITTIAAVCALSSTAAICASAASETYTHTVTLSSDSGSTTGTWMYMKKVGTCSDVFSTYPTIFDNYSTSYNKSRVKHSDGKTMTKYQSFILQKNSPAPTTISYGKLTKTGDWHLFYQHESGGGFKATVNTIKRY